MHRKRYPILLLLALVLAALAPTARAEGWATNQRSSFDPDEVDRAIQRGIEHLWSTQQPDGTWPAYGNNGKNYHKYGPTALAAYALLEAGVNPQDPPMAKALDALTRERLQRTYSLGLRCNVWQQANKKTNNKYKKYLENDKKQLMYSISQKDASYGYYALGDYKKSREKDGSWDNSNSQYGLLGVWAAIRNSPPCEVNDKYWQYVMQHWQRHQNPDGGWGYRAEDKTTSTMTAAGVASMFVCFDNLMLDKFVGCAARTDHPAAEAIQQGLDWFDQNFEQSLRGGNFGHGDLYYYLYGIERVGLAAGYKYFGDADWYRLGARELLKKQRADGSWKGRRDSYVSTSFALLFLVRGRNPMLFNKLEFDGDWNNRPRDLAGLTRWISKTYERTVNWQIINLDVPVHEWHDAPILYISGSKAPNFTDGQIAKLREYVLQGGTIFSATECNGAQFSKGIREVYTRMFPDYELQQLGNEHPIYSLYFNLQGQPPLYELSNGVRPLVIHADRDLPRAWQVMQENTNRNAYEVAANMYLYITDFGSLDYRGVQSWPVEPEGQPQTTVKLARVKFNGNYNPEPLAHQRFRRLIARRTPVKVETTDPLWPSELTDSGARVAHLSGTGRIHLPEEEVQTLKQFVEDGGMLIMDAAGGDETFKESAESLIRQITIERLRYLPASHRVYNLPDYEIEQVDYRRSAQKRLGRRDAPVLRGVTFDDRLGIVLSREDITGGLVGFESASCDGYAPGSAFKLMRNLVLYGSGEGIQ